MKSLGLYAPLYVYKSTPVIVINKGGKDEERKKIGRLREVEFERKI